MKKTSVLCVLSALVLGACDDYIDITRYSGYVQNCYHDIIDNPNNCTQNKRTVVKYCRCSEQAEVLIRQKKAEMQNNAQAGSQFYSGFGFFGALAQMEDVVQARRQLYDYTQKLYNNCAKDTGYTRIANCPKKEQTTETTTENNDAQGK